MNSVDFPLKAQVANMRYRELLDEAAKQRRVKELYAVQAPMRRNVVAELRSALASVLFRTATWLTPDECGGLELRPGR